MKTIFDLGMHEGWDTEFYLKKGFRVVAVEASPQFLAAVQERLSAYLASGQLQIVNKAIASSEGVKVPFYVRTDKDGWSSIHRDAAERDGATSTRIDVESVTVNGLFAQFGVPYFLKCDIEGADELVAEQLAEAKEKPRFVSFEASPGDDRLIDLLVAAGYARFQAVNQGHLSLYTPPRPAREAAYVAQRFHGKMSGLFGEELDPRFWAGEREIRERLRLWQRLAAGRVDPLRTFILKKYGRLTRRTWLIGSGWLDIHAAR